MLKYYIILIGLVVLASSTNIKAQIIYTDIPDTTIVFPDNPYLGDSTNYFYFNLNGDSVNDFYFQLRHYRKWLSPNFQAFYYINLLHALDSSFISRNYDGPYCVIDFNEGDTIGNSLFWSYVGYIYVNLPEPPSVYINCNLPFEDRYYGLKIQIDDKSHFGWVQLDADISQVTVKSYAYNSIPDMPVLAGQTQSVSVDEPKTKEKFQIINNNGKLLVGTKEGSMLIRQINIYNLTGKLVTSKTINDYQTEVNVEFLNTGMYIIKIIFEEHTYSELFFIR